MKIYKPEGADLQPLIAVATKDQSPEAWREKMLSAIAAILEKTPYRYRAYGPYWWVLKRMLIDRGGFKFGDFIDQEWLEQMDYGDPTLNLAAAYAYEDVRFAIGLMANPDHQLETIDGEMVEYVIADPDMEG